MSSTARPPPPPFLPISVLTKSHALISAIGKVLATGFYFKYTLPINCTHCTNSNTYCTKVFLPKNNTSFIIFKRLLHTKRSQTEYRSHKWVHQDWVMNFQNDYLVSTIAFKCLFYIKTGTEKWIAWVFHQGRY